MNDWLRQVFKGRPGWMNALLAFCAFMTFVYMPWDLFIKPVADDQEVWFGILFTGWSAKLLEVPHWAVYAAGFYGFLRMRRWMWPWASLYVAQIALGMFVWSALHGPGGGGTLMGAVSFVAFGGLALALWRARPGFSGNLGPLRERYGDWALVTGASAGIGAAFVRALASEGMSCVLTARREEPMHQLASEMEKHGVATRVVVADLTEPGGVDTLVRAVADLEIGLLVNNAGFGYAGRFDKQDGARLRSMIQLNCVVPVDLTSRLLPGMLERGRGAIVITGSVAGRQALPLHGVYSATKAFDLLFGEALSLELRGRGVDVLVIEPGSTETEFQQVAGERAHSGESADKVVGVALDALGRQPSVVSGWFNWLRAGAASRLLTRPLVSHIAHGVVAREVPDEMR